MDKRIQFFLCEIETQSEYALRAVREANSQGGVRHFWYSVQAFLVSVANVSKILWPKDPKYASRGQSLRTLLGVSDQSLIKPVRFRNHFEHFDERLEKWLASPKPRAYVDFCSGPLSSFGGLDRKHYLRNYATDVDKLFFMGEEYHVAPVVAEVKALRERALGLLQP